jgi:hypothetical protein
VADGDFRARCLCGYIYPDAVALAAEFDDREPCPSCGSKAVVLDVEASDEATVHSMVRVKGRWPGLKRPYLEMKAGDELHYDSGRWQRITRHIDRQRDRYSERIVDYETGELIRECDEPLSEHRRRGSARRREDSH